MDLSNPISAVVPGGRGLVLAVLARTTEPLSGRRIAELAGDGVAKTRVSTLLNELVRSGVVLADENPPAVLYRLNRDHLAAAAIEALATMRERLIAGLRDEIAGWDPAVATAWLFGSVARGEGGEDSDLDIAVVRPDAVDPDDTRWAEQLGRLGALIAQSTGNEASVIEYSETEVATLSASGERIVDSIRADGIHLAGRRRLAADPVRA